MESLGIYSARFGYKVPMTSSLSLIGFCEWFVAGVALGLGMALANGIIGLFSGGFRRS